ncbi:MAG: hypothetical protein CBC47_02300 [Alphaproteobacteria bacterium TMED87]|nr:competence/damage-inducible protein A [Rhodospirillaceae bacterium]OUV10903.1 MAG: hypothetical protein CBC47_02300 [Alphaproteobacteria bacterium TMED87]|tara:strand:+ start:23 stop:775 length:753 start_codon:yes stop_codon:yes gene_type:complete
MDKKLSAALIIIGNEILSGRTQDSNMQFLGRELGKIGIFLEEVRVIADNEDKIIETVHQLRNNYDYIFTTGGIGPTHDDITSLSIAKAFGVELELHEPSAKKMKEHYGGNLNEARLKMAHIPSGSSPIETRITSAPGFKIENVFVLAGVPMIARAMFDALSPELSVGPPIISRYIEALLGEGELANQLEKIQNKFSDVDIGSYPFFRKGEIGLSVVAKGINSEAINNIINEVEKIIKSKNCKYCIDDEVI